MYSSACQENTVTGCYLAGTVSVGMAQRRYRLKIEPTDTAPGWKLGKSRVLPRRFTIQVQKYLRYSQDGRTQTELSGAEVDALLDVASATRQDWTRIRFGKWLELEVESSPTEPPRCVVLRAPGGISTPEQRFPLAGIVTEAAARIASKDGSFVDYPLGIEYEDTLFEARRGRGRKRARRAVTPDRLEEVARIAEEHPRTPTAAVQHHFGISRGYARKLIKLAIR
jgi:hypothetical protein